MITDRPTTAAFNADLVALVAFEARRLLELHDLGPLRAEVIGLRREVQALRDAERRRLLEAVVA